MGEQTERSRRANERRRNDEKATRIMRLARMGYSNVEISRLLAAEGEPTSRSRVGVILKRALQDAGAERMDVARELFDLELERLNWIIQQATRILLEDCKGCNGQGRFQNGEHCDVCRGDGRANHPDTRLRASKEIRNAIHQRSQMLGMYQPEKFIVEHTDGTLKPELRRVVEAMDMDSLSQAIDDFQAGVAAATALHVDDQLQT